MRDNTVTTEIPARIGGDAGPLYQYDYGQRLIFTGVELPPEYEVHFANDEKGKSITMIGNSTGVDVPDALLLTGKDIHVWLYMHTGEDDGETAYHVRIRVIRRALPTHEEPTPVQQSEIEQLIAELIAAVERSESNVLNYPKIVDGEWYVWDAEQNDFVGTGIMAEGQDYVLTDEDKVEIAELVGEVVGIPTKTSDLVNDSGFISEETDPTVPAWAKAAQKPTYTKSEVGLGNVMNERQYSAQNPPPHDTTKVDTAMIGRANGVAGLDSAGKVPSSQLPSYVDDVVEYPTLNDFPETGESGKIYVDLSTNKTYRWGGSEYVVIASDLALGETSSTAYWGDRGKAAYDHAQAKGNAYASGLYKIATNSEGHVTGATAVAKADIEALGIDKEVIVSGTQPSADGNKVWINETTGAEYSVPTVTEMQAADALKVSKPVTSPNGTNGQLLQTNGDGTTTWVTAGTPTDTQVGTAVEAWLDDHPEATTTVQDGAVTWAKLDSGTQNAVNGIPACCTDDAGLPVIGWESGGMYDATGIDYVSIEYCRTRFIPVTPGSTITFVTEGEEQNYSLYIHEFTDNVTTTSETNVRTRRSALAGGNVRRNITLQDTTNYIRVNIKRAYVTGKVVMLSGNECVAGYPYVKTYTADDIDAGNVRWETGEGYSSSTRIHTAKMIHLEPGAVIHFVPGVKTGEVYVLFRQSDRIPFFNYRSAGWISAETTYTNYQDGDMMFILAAPGRSDAISPEDFDCTLTVSTPVVRHTAKAYPCLQMMLKDETLQIGQLVRTFGFDYMGDCGGGYYEITTSGTVNNCTVFAAANDKLYAKRVFVEPYVYLESLNIERVSWSVIEGVLANNRFNDIRCNVITTPETIVITNSDFTFGKINYTGTDYALVLDSSMCHRIRGDIISAPSGSGLKVTCTTQTCCRNDVRINEILALDTGFAIRPVNSHGLMHNIYCVNYIKTSQKGLSSYIPHESGTYSWEGEEYFVLKQVEVYNDNEDGIGIDMRIDPNPETGVTESGTFTGITFGSLAVEYSNIGISMNCGSYNGSNIDACIKSIYILELRTRESTRTKMFLTGNGYIRDVYIKPTTPVQLSQISFSTGSGNAPCIIDNYVAIGYHLHIIGYGIRFQLGQTYVTRRLPKKVLIEGDADFSCLSGDIPYPYPEWIVFADQYDISPDLLGQTVNINLKYFWQESETGIRFKLPGAVNGNAVTVNIRYMSPGKKITLTNTSADPHVYQINVNQISAEWNKNYTFTVMDLGVPEQEYTVPYYYNDPT